MKRTEGEWRSYAKKNNFAIVGEFDNEHGERFVVYRLPGVVTDFVTGDELDWELGW